MTKKKASDDPTYPAKFFAGLFGITERRIQQLAKDEIIPKAGRGRYPLTGTVQNYVRYLQTLRASPDAFPTPDQVLDPTQEKARLDRERWIYQEFKTEIEKGNWAEVALLGFIVSKTGAAIAAQLEALPRKLKKLSPQLTATSVLMMEKEIAKTLNLAADAHLSMDDWLDEWEHGGKSSTK